MAEVVCLWDIPQAKVVRQKFWQKDFRPYPLYEVQVNGERWASGFFTRRGARKWIVENRDWLLEVGQLPPFNF